MKAVRTIALLAPLTLAGCALVLCGCKTVGPNYKAPPVPAPPSFSDDGHNGDWASATPADAADRGTWWAIYQDPGLNTLEQRCASANQNIAASLHAYQQAHDLVRQAHASLYPTVSIGGSATRNRLSANTPGLSPTASHDYWEFLIPLNISWEPDFWGAVRRQIESASASAQASAADLASTRLSLQGLLAVTYLQLRGLDLQAQLLRATIDAYTQTLNLTQVRLKGGLSTESDLAEAQAQLEEARAQLIDLGVQRAQYEHAIAVLVGEPATAFHIPEQPLVGDPPAIPTGVPSELLQRRPDIAAAERRVAAANALIGVAKAAYYPNITLGAEGGMESDRSAASSAPAARSGTPAHPPASFSTTRAAAARRWTTPSPSAIRPPHSIGNRYCLPSAMWRTSSPRCACCSRRPRSSSAPSTPHGTAPSYQRCAINRGSPPTSKSSPTRPSS